MKIEYWEFKVSYRYCYSSYKEFKSVVKNDSNKTMREYYVLYTDIEDLSCHLQYVLGYVLARHEETIRVKEMSHYDYECEAIDMCTTAYVTPSFGCTSPFATPMPVYPTVAEVKARYSSLDCKPAINPVTKNNGNKTMYYDYRDNLKAEQTYLLDRADTARCAFRRDAEKKFLSRPSVPTTAADIVAAITAGNITVLSKGDEGFHSYSAMDNIIFAKDWKRDEAGYTAAEKAITAAYQTAKDLIVVSEPKDGLTALQAFEATIV